MQDKISQEELRKVLLDTATAICNEESCRKPYIIGTKEFFRIWDDELKIPKDGRDRYILPDRFEGR